MGLRFIERSAVVAGLALLALYGGIRLHGRVMGKADLRRFAEVRRNLSGETNRGTAVPRAVDASRWSAGRIAAFEQSSTQNAGAPLGVLRIPKIHLEVPLLDGIDEATLNQAVGRIPGTARPGQPGNLGIAGHRDGFFRGLKDLAQGDVIDLETLRGSEAYVVSQITIVDPSDVGVLDPTAGPTLTLVTCYPFYYVGSAPQRYVVRADRRDAESAAGVRTP